MPLIPILKRDKRESGVEMLYSVYNRLGIENAEGVKLMDNDMIFSLLESIGYEWDEDQSAWKRELLRKHTV